MDMCTVLSDLGLLLHLWCSIQMRQKEFLFKREKERKIKPSKTEHERPYLVLVMVKLNGQIGLPSKNICMDSVQSHSCV